LKAVDTNILIRWITGDDEHQAAMAGAIIAEPLFVPLTVLLETAWVLSARRYGLDRSEVAAALLAVIDMDTVHIEAPVAVRWAIGRYSEGADFADMLHLVASRRAEGFVTFDRNLARRSGSDTPLQVQTIV